MPYTVERLTSHSAVLITFQDDFNIEDEYIKFGQDAKVILDAELTTIAVIIDLRAYKFSLGDLMNGTRIAMNNPEFNLSLHPKTDRFILVSENRLVKASLDGFSKLGLGDREIALTVEDALAMLTASSQSRGA